MEFRTHDREKLTHLLRTRGYRRAPEGQPFKLASGKESMHFCDVKSVAMNPSGLRLTVAGLHALTRELVNGMPDDPGLDAVAGVALGGCPLATGYSLETNLDCLYVRKEAKDHGTKKLVEGTPELMAQGSGRVLLVEDVCTTGGSSLKAVEALRSAGFEVVCIAVVVDRQEGGQEAIEAKGIPFRSLFTLREIAEG